MQDLGDLDISSNPLATLRRDVENHWRKYLPKMTAELEAEGVQVTAQYHFCLPAVQPPLLNQGNQERAGSAENPGLRQQRTDSFTVDIAGHRCPRADDTDSVIPGDFSRSVGRRGNDVKYRHFKIFPQYIRRRTGSRVAGDDNELRSLLQEKISVVPGVAGNCLRTL